MHIPILNIYALLSLPKRQADPSPFLLLLPARAANFHTPCAKFPSHPTQGHTRQLSGRQAGAAAQTSWARTYVDPRRIAPIASLKCTLSVILCFHHMYTSLSFSIYKILHFIFATGKLYSWFNNILLTSRVARKIDKYIA